jgi:D-tyrosyl-tRNA(Tyr) deacylase
MHDQILQRDMSPYVDVTFWVSTKHGQVLQGRAGRKNARRAFAQIKSQDADTNVAKDLGKFQQIPQIIVAKHRGSAQNDPNRLTVPYVGNMATPSTDGASKLVECLSKLPQGDRQIVIQINKHKSGRSYSHENIEQTQDLSDPSK